MSAPVLLAAGLGGLTVALVVGAIVRPTRRLEPRVWPYAQLARSRLGESADLAVLGGVGSPVSSGTIGRVFGPLILGAAQRFSTVIDAAGDAQLRLRLRQAGYFDTSPEQYRIRQLGWAVVGALAGGFLGAVTFDTLGALLVGLIGLVWGATFWRGRVNRAISARRARMRVELYTVAHLLAMLVRTGRGPVESLHEVVRRGRGPAVEELAEALRWIAGGMNEGEALDRLAEDSPEPAAARLYRLIAAGIEAGGDLGSSLLVISDDLRAERREDVERLATTRRGTMLIPTILVMAPVVFVFLLFPLPSVIFGTQ